VAAAERRALTKGEVALAREAFGAAIDYDRIAICAGAGGNPVAWLAFCHGNPAITLVGTIHLRAGPAADFSAAGEEELTLFMHEMTHVWQYRRLGLLPFLLRYGRDFLRCGLRAAAMYRYAAGVDSFAAARLEAQADMIGHYSRALRRGDAVALEILGRNLRGSGLYGR